jgi:MFS family permease
MDWRRREVPTLLLGVALAASAVLLLALQWDFTYFQDTWAFLLERQDFSADDFLRPHNEHLVVIPVAITQACVALFGMTSALPEAIVMMLTLLAAAALLFVYVRRRVGAWLALLAALPVLFLGSAWMILLWPFEVEFSGAIMAGLGALLLLERQDRRGDAWACVLLIVSLGFGSLALSFVAAAAVDVLQHHRRRGWRRAYVAIVPLLLYLLWYAGWGHAAAHHLTPHNVLESPRFLLDGLASSAASLAGLNTETGAATADPTWGRPLLVGLIALAVFWKWRRPGISPRFWPVAAATLSYWLLAGFNYIPGREAASNRYVYAGVIFLLMMGADLLQGVRPGRRALMVVTVVTLLTLGPNIALMREGGDVLKQQSLLTRADLAALEIARRTVPPDFALTPENAGTLANVAIVPGPYFEAVDAHGSPAYTTSELAAAPSADRFWADILLSQVLPLEVETRPTEALPRDRRPCAALSPDPGQGASEVPVGPGTTKIWTGPGPTAKLMLRRFATTEYPVDLGAVAGASLALLHIPRDHASQRWYVHIDASQGALVCG